MREGVALKATIQHATHQLLILVDQWLRDPVHDCLRARGDSRWQEMIELEAKLKGKEMT